MYTHVTEFIRQRITVPDEALQRAISHSRVVHYRKGDTIIRATEYCRFIGFLNTGIIVVTIADEAGRDVVCNFFFEKEFFTYVEGIHANIPSDKNFIALEDCEVLVISKDDLPAIFAIHRGFELLFNMVILEGLKRMILFAQEKHTRSIEERYLHMLNTEPEMINRIPLKIIANYLGVAPPSLSRLRKRLAQKKREINVG